ncbi:MAG TPA: molybdopterin-dependent oxidoreductase [Kiritimatiellia bacterium]|nr:molybdopterin-dependent oxidoreductase [Kiritimatiellia bacterium]
MSSNNLFSAWINGEPIERTADGKQTLMHFLRDELGLKGTKNACGKGHCGSCTVLVNGEAKRSCLLALDRLQGSRILTIEGLALETGAAGWTPERRGHFAGIQPEERRARNQVYREPAYCEGRNSIYDAAPRYEELHPIQRAFADEGAVQCGFCTPGLVLATKALLDKNPDPDEATIRAALRHNLCRCTGYGAILRAVKRAAAYLSGTLAVPPDRVPETGIRGPGTSPIRKDALAKAAGLPVFSDDYEADGALHGVLLFSEHAHARIVAIDCSAAREQPGVALVLTGADVPGRNAFGLFVPQQPVIARDEVKYLGEIVAVVFADTRAQAEAARALIRVEYEVLPALLNPLETVRADSPRVHADTPDNIVHHVAVHKGDVDTAFAAADVVIEGHYETPAVEHAYLEPEACLVTIAPDGQLTVYTGNQGSVSFREQIAASLLIPPERVRVVLAACGGGFGGKEEPTVQIQAALGALRTGRPVKMVLTREESIRLSTKRHPMHIRMKHGATRDGRIVALESEVVADGGAYISQSKPVVFRSAVTATGPYVVENVKADSRGVYTHKNPSGAFRGFGSTQACFACEIQMDKLARALDMSPVELRRRNGFRPGAQTGTGQTLGPGVGYLGTLDAAARGLEALRIEFADRERPTHINVGFGLASAYKNVGIGTGKPDAAGAIVEVLESGRVLVLTGASDIGQGSDTLAAQIASQELSVPYDLIDVRACDTLVSPDGGMTTASRQTYVTGNAVRGAAQQLREKLAVVLSPGGSPADQAALARAWAAATKSGNPLRAEFTYFPPKTYAHQTDANPQPGKTPEEFDIHYSYCFGSAAVAVEVNTHTGEVTVLKVVAAQDVGKALHPKNVIGQIEGAVAMGLGMGLSEEFREDDRRIYTDNLARLNLFTSQTMPPVDAVFVETAEPEGPYGAKGMGEVGLNPLPPALSNAIFDAVGIRLHALPMKKDKVLAALGR